MLQQNANYLARAVCGYFVHIKTIFVCFQVVSAPVGTTHCSDRSALEYRELQDDYYKLIDIAAELIDCLEQSCQGKAVSESVLFVGVHIAALIWM